MIIIAGSIDFASQEDRDAAVANAVEFQESTRADEPGCVEYSFAPDSGCPTRVQVFELWADEASLAAHFEHPNFWATKALLREFKRAGESAVAKYRVDATASVYGPDGTPDAGFADA